MAISANEFYKKILKLETTRQNGITALAGKGVNLSENASLPAIIGGIEAIQTTKQPTPTQITLNTTGSRIIYTAELPNIKITLKNASGDVVANQTTNTSTGGVVSFTVSADGVYTLVATNSADEEIWTNTINIDGVGQYKCPVGKALNDYTWEEIQKYISTYGYGKYMFRINGTEYKQTNFMSKGETSKYSRAYLVHQAENGRLVFMFRDFNTTYKHTSSNTTNINGISWMGSAIRTNCLEVGDIQYTYVPSVSATTSGEYYVYNVDTATFEQVSLPTDYVAKTKYYTRTVIATEGAVLTSLKAQLGLDSNGQQIMPLKVDKYTWTGYGGNTTSETLAKEDDTLIKTTDYIFLPSDSEIWGKDNRFVNYSKYLLEGEQFLAFKNYREDVFRFSGSSNTAYRWLRSPYLAGGTYFCYWNTNGGLNNYSANSTYCAPFCFYL